MIMVMDYHEYLNDWLWAKTTIKCAQRDSSLCIALTRVCVWIWSSC